MKSDSERSISMMGNANASRVLSDDDRALIRELYDSWKVLRAQADAISPKAIAEKFDIHPNTLHKVVR